MIQEEEPPAKEEQKDQYNSNGTSKDVQLAEEGAGEESTLSVGAQQNTSVGAGSGRNSIGPAEAPGKELALDELMRLYTRVEKTRDPTMCAKIASELESTLAKFKQLSASLSSCPSPEITPTPAASAVPQPEPTEPAAADTPSPTTSQANSTPTPKPGATRRSDKVRRPVSKYNATKPSPSKRVPLHSAAGSRNGGGTKLTEAKDSQKTEEKKREHAGDKKRPKSSKKDHGEGMSEELKQKVYELYGDDAQFDAIQSELATAYSSYCKTSARIKEKKRSKSATPNRSANYKEVVLKLHNKLLQQQKESEADILKRLVDRQKNAQQQRDQKFKERQQAARKNKERQQQVKERHAELEAEKHKLLAENEQKLQMADGRYEKRISDIKMKARAEGERVEEVLFIKETGTANKKVLFDSKLSETSERRKAIIDHTKQKQDVVGQRTGMAEKKRLALLEEQKAKLQQNQQRRDDAEVRRKGFIDQRKLVAESEVQRATQAGERKRQLYDEVIELYSYLCKKENLWECLEKGLQGRAEDADLTKLTPFERIKRQLMQDYAELV